MKLFFASPIPRYVKLLKEENASNFLVSYATKNICVSIIKDGNLDSGDSLIIDSGAFSAWTKNVKINLSEYIDFCHETVKLKPCNNIYFINLDVIPGSFGKRPTNEQIEESAKKGMENYQIMKRAGLKVMPVFHQHEDFKWLKEMIKEIDYIGISPANDVSVKRRINWLKKVYSLMKADYKTHLFGFTAFEALKQFPCYSADSTSWLAPARYGQYVTFDKDKIKTFRGRDKKLTNESYMMIRDRETKGMNIEIIRLQVIELLKIQSYITRLWEKRGIKWD